MTRCVSICIYSSILLSQTDFSPAVKQLKDIHLMEQLHHHLAQRARRKAIYRFRVSKMGNTIQLCTGSQGNEDLNQQIQVNYPYIVVMEMDTTTDQFLVAKRVMV